MTEAELQQLAEEIGGQLTGNKGVTFQAKFYSSRSLNHKIKKEKNTIHIQIAKGLHQAPDRVIRALLIILMLKLYRIKIDRKWYKIYRTYLEENPHLLPVRKIRKPSNAYQAQGRYYDLDALFAELNKTYFNNRLKKPILGWSLRKSYRRLGFYSAEKNLLVISRIFDAKRVPLEVVQFLLYHEMLHMTIPVQKINGRRRVHTHEFKKKEQQFPRYDTIQKWIKTNLKRL